MKLHGRSILFVLAVASAAIAVHAQNAASKPDIDRCTDWLKTTVPADMRVDAGAFCAGAKQEDNPNLGGWHSVDHCGTAAKPSPDGKESYCASSGIIAPDWAIAAGFRSGAEDGGDLMPKNGDSAGAAATLYTLEPVQIEQLHLAAGLYRFALSHPVDGWKMTVTAETGKEIGTLLLKTAEHLTYFGSGLAIGVVYSGFRCKDPVNIHELTFTYGGNELYACLQPDHISPGEKFFAKQ